MTQGPARATGEHTLEPIPGGHSPLGRSMDGHAVTALRREPREVRAPRIARGWLVRRLLLLADLVGVLGAFLITTLLVNGPILAETLTTEYALILGALPLWIVSAKLYGLYDRDVERATHSGLDDVVPIFHMVLVMTCLLGVFSALASFADPSLSRLLVFAAIASASILGTRAIVRTGIRHDTRLRQNTVIVGAGDVGQLFARKLLQHPEYGVNLVGFLDHAPKERRDDLGDLTLLGTPDELLEIVREHAIDRVIIAFSGDRHDETLRIVRSVKDLDIRIDIVPRLFEIVGATADIHTVEGMPLVSIASLRLSRSSRLLKRGFDLVFASVALVVLAPVLALFALLIKLDSPGPVFFRQARIGTGDRRFVIVKFRTMAGDADARKQEVAHLNMHARPGGDGRMFKIPDDPRVTSVGRLLRRYSLDELPQLVNVVKGEMSIVGPRPLIPEEDCYVPDWARQRLSLKPGLTGLWQVLGRTDIPFDEMTRLDYLYVTNWSMWRDVQLILRTLPAILRQSQVY
jgi:exopolysaccharide biosynthesis polyprenyl glycosylphosphotransferase